MRRGEKLPEPVALGVFDLAAKERGRHLVRFVADDEIPAAVGRLQLLLHVLVARELVEPGDDEVCFQEPVAGAGGLELVVGENLERQMKAAIQLVLPLFGQAAGQTTRQRCKSPRAISSFISRPGHDRLAGARDRRPAGSAAAGAAASTRRRP